MSTPRQTGTIVATRFNDAISIEKQAAAVFSYLKPDDGWDEYFYPKRRYDKTGDLYIKVEKKIKNLAFGDLAARVIVEFRGNSHDYPLTVKFSPPVPFGGISFKNMQDAIQFINETESVILEEYQKLV